MHYSPKATIFFYYYNIYNNYGLLRLLMEFTVYFLGPLPPEIHSNNFWEEYFLTTL